MFNYTRFNPNQGLQALFDHCCTQSVFLSKKVKPMSENVKDLVQKKNHSNPIQTWIHKHPVSKPTLIPKWIGVILIGLCLFSFGCGRYQLTQKIPQLPSFEADSDLPPSVIPNLNQALSPHLRSNQAQWWTQFQNPELNQLLKAFFTDNLALKQAQQRILQMHLIAQQNGSQRWPSIQLDLGWSRTKQLNPFARLNSSSSTSSQMTPPSNSMTGTNPMMGGGFGSLPESFTQDSYRASMSVSYEVDVWGRIGSLIDAFEKDALAVEFDAYALAMTLSSTVVETWLLLIEAQKRLHITQAQLKSEQDLLHLTEARFEQGLAPQIQVLQQQQQKERTEAQLPLIHGQIIQIKRQLALLIGVSSIKKIKTPSTLPSLPPLPKIGLSGDLLMQRPDLLAAHMRLFAADARVASALSARYPALRLGGSLGFQSFEPDELFDDWIWSLSTNLLAPLFQAGRLKAEQQRQESILKERWLTLKEKMLIAYQEVQNALTWETQYQVHLKTLNQQLISAQELVERAQDRYMQGMGDFLTVLSARQGLYATQQAHLSAQRQALSYRVQLHRALGGGWSSSSTFGKNVGGKKEKHLSSVKSMTP